MPELSDYLQEVSASTKPKQKLLVTQEYESPFLLYLLKRMFHPNLKSNLKIKSTDVPDPGSGRIEDYESEIRELLSEMSMSFSHVKNWEMAAEVLKELNEGSQTLLVSVINKKSGAGLSSKGIKKLYPDLWPAWEVQLANQYKEKRTTDMNKEYHWSPKLDGVRVLCCREDDGKWYKRSRLGNDFETLDHWDEDLERYYEKTGCTFLDSEAYNHNLKFEEIVGKVKRAKDPSGGKELDCYCFIAGSYEGVKNLDASGFVVNELEFGHIKRVDRGLITLKEALDKVSDLILEGFEGIMLRDPDIIYDFKRSDALLKLKVMYQMDCEVIGVLFGDFPIREEGVESVERTLTNIVVVQENGVVCPVGSGFTLPFRREVYRDSGGILGCTGLVAYQNFGTDGGMRFPVWLGPRIDK